MPSRGWCEWPEISRSTGCGSSNGHAAWRRPTICRRSTRSESTCSARCSLLPKQREVVVLRYVVDLPEAEVAETLGCSVGTVKTHASRGLAALRRSLEVAR